MRLQRLLMTIAVASTCLFVEATEPFRMASDKGQTSKIKIGKTFTGNEFIAPFSTNQEITGLCISGSFEKRKDDYLVRVILIDKEEHEYLVLESYDMICDDKKFILDDYCEETMFINNIIPQKMKIILTNAELTIDRISYRHASKSAPIDITQQEKTRRSQIEHKIKSINAFNQAHNKLWVAGETPLSYKSYEEKIKLIGGGGNTIPDGFEYYVGGIFEAGHTISTTRQQINLPFVESFDWRNRHGKNWLNSVKDQQESNYCIAFATAGTMEALMNLYYNQKLNLDLSAEHIASCADYGVYQYGMYYEDALSYVRDYGVCDDDSYPFENNPNATCHIDEITYNKLVKIDSYNEIGNESPDSIKKALINYGPLASGYIGHGMVLVGYRVIHAGDSIRISDGDTPGNHIYIPIGSPYIGRTYWIFKNSYGTESGITTDGGYAYILFNNMSFMRGPYKLNYPFTILPISTYVVNCEDADGDGYYTWGLGPRPSNCPSWAPSEQDGDDSDPNYGPMDQYGNLTAIDNSSQTVITGNIVYDTNMTLSRDVIVSPNAVLTITGNVTFNDNVKIVVQPTGILVINGGILNNSDLLLNTGSHVVVSNGGIVNMRSGRDFYATTGVSVDVTNGVIQ